MTARKRSKVHGGVRSGAGRKGFIKDAYRLSVNFPGTDFDALEQLAEERGASIAAVVREAVRAYLEKNRRG